MYSARSLSFTIGWYGGRRMRWQTFEEHHATRAATVGGTDHSRKSRDMCRVASPGKHTSQVGCPLSDRPTVSRRCNNRVKSAKT